jgi:hypothetical protein
VPLLEAPLADRRNWTQGQHGRASGKGFSPSRAQDKNASPRARDLQGLIDRRALGNQCGRWGPTFAALIILWSHRTRGWLCAG